MKLLSAIAVFFLMAGPASALMITEVQIAGDQTDHDYVVIHNPLNESIDLSGYSLRKKSSTGRSHSLRVFPRGTTISETGYLTWANSRDGFAEKIEAGLASTATLAKNNSVALIDSDGQRLSSLAWGEGSEQFQEGVPVSNPEPNQQIKRKHDDHYSDTGSNLDDFYLTDRPHSDKIPLVEPYRRYQPRTIAGPAIAALLVSLFSVKIFNIYRKL